MLSTSPGLPQLQVGIGWSSASRPSVKIWTCPSSPAMPAAPRTTWPASITPPPRPVPTMAETEESHRRIGTEVDLVGIQGSGIAIVVVDDRQADARLQRAAHVEAPPGGLREVRGAPGADDAVGACRAGRIQPDRRDTRRDRCRSRGARGPSSRPSPRWRPPAPRRPGSGSRTSDPPGSGPMRRAPWRCSWWPPLSMPTTTRSAFHATHRSLRDSGCVV